MTDAQIFWVRYINAAGGVRQRLAVLGTHDESTARLLLEQQSGAIVMQLWRVPAWLSKVWHYVVPLMRRQWPYDQLADFFHNLGIMLKSGLGLKPIQKTKNTRNPRVPISRRLRSKR